MVVVEGVARKINPNTNIWHVSRPILENWLKEIKDPINTISETVIQSSEVFKKLPNFPEFIEKANDAITLIAEGKLNITNRNLDAFREEKIKLKLFRNNLASLFLVLVIFILIVFK
jgi:ubiquinone biosynthesis protein